jgi:ribokinase
MYRAFAQLLVVGSIAMDFVFDVPTYPNEGDQLEGKVHIRPGGKGLFQAIACQRLRAETTLVTSAGDDYFADLISEVIEREKVKLCIDKQEVSTANDSPFATDVVGSIATKGKKTTYIACRDRSRLTTQFLQEQCSALISECNGVLISLDVSTDVVKNIVELAIKQEKGIPIVVNASPPLKAPIALINGASTMIATKDEARDWLGLSGHISDKAKLEALTTEEIGDAFLKAGAKKVILTLDDEGCVVIDQRAVREYEAFTGGPGSRPGGTGARSAFCAAYAVWLAEHHRDQHADVSEHEAINFASAARHNARLHSSLGWDAMAKRPVIDEFLADVAEVKMRHEERRKSSR